MALVQFPTSPSLNQTYTVGSKTWKWNGYAWDLVLTTTPNTAFNIVGGSANQILYQTSSNTTGFITAPSNGTFLFYTTTGGFSWSAASGASVGTANIATYSTVTNATTGTYYPTFVTTTSGNLSEYSNSAFVFDVTNGRLGIGVASPSQKLDVNGSIRVNNNIVAQGSLIGYSGNGAFLSWESTYGRLEAYSYTSSTYQNMCISPNGGNVGIGTSSPGYKLEVSGQALFSAGASQFTILSATSGYSSGLQFYRAGYNTWYVGSTNNSTGFGIGENLSSPSMWFSSGGNVGVGTSSPGARLTTVANGENIRMVGSSAYISFYDGTQTTRYGYMQHNGTTLALVNSVNGPLTFYTNNTLNATLDTSGNFTLNSGGGFVTTKGGIYPEGSGSAYTTTGYLRFVNGSTETARIDSSGRLLSGTTSAQYQTSNGSINLVTGASLSSGSFGRIWAPGQQIGSATFAGLYGLASTYLAYYDGSNWRSLGGGTASAVTIDEGIFSFSNSNGVGAIDSLLTWSTRFVINAAGNTGIGTASPTYKLDVAGTANTGPLTVSSLNITGTTANTIHYNTGTGTGFITAPSNGTFLYYTTASGFSWQAATAASVGTANVATYSNVTLATTGLYYPGFYSASSGTLGVYANGSLYYTATTGTLTAGIFSATNNGNGTNFQVGDDAWIGDVNVSNTLRVMGQQNNANGYIIFGNGDANALGRAGTGALTYGGNAVLHAGNFNSYAPTLTGTGASGNWNINASSSNNISGGAANQIHYQTGAGTTGFITAPSNGTFLYYTTASGFSWQLSSAASVGTANVATYSTVTNATSGTYYPTIANATSGNLQEYSNNAFIFDVTNGRFGVGVTPTYNLHVNGSFAATTKSFVIDHPTKLNKKLRYGSLEGPENGVYIRGRLEDENTILLPEYWTKLVDEDSITVNLTPIGKSQNLYVSDISHNKIVIDGSKNINCFYTIFAERADVDKLEVEFY